MSELSKPTIAIVDYGLGNIFSVKQACEHAGMQAHVTSSPKEIANAQAVLLPGVGAFADAMGALSRLDLISPIHDLIATGRPFFGVCLGLQLLLTESYEFSLTKGLGVIPGSVVRFEFSDPAKNLKVPQVSWNRIYRPRLSETVAADIDPWKSTPLDGISDGSFMYFVHSYYARPADPRVITSLTKYGEIEFCSSFCFNNVFAMQFHPERSGPGGLEIYRKIASLTRN